MADSDSVVCPQCKVGFAPDTAICPLCKIPFVSEDEFEDESNETPEPVILNEDLSSLKELRTADVGWIHHLQDNLAVAKIPHCIKQSDPPRMLFRSTFGLRTCPMQKISMRRSLRWRFRMARECPTQRISISGLARVVATGLGRKTSSAVAAASSCCQPRAGGAVTVMRRWSLKLRCVPTAGVASTGVRSSFEKIIGFLPHFEDPG
jgi:hypothetical protein